MFIILTINQYNYPYYKSINYRTEKCSHVQCILPVDSCHGTTPIGMSDCIIVTSGYHGSIRKTIISNNSTI